MPSMYKYIKLTLDYRYVALRIFPEIKNCSLLNNSSLEKIHEKAKKGHKNVRNRPYGFEIYLVNVKTKLGTYLINQNHKDDCANFCALLRKADL